MSEFPARKWNTAIVVILKDEAPYIDNWILHHLALGFEHIFIYDNNSTDRIADALTRFINGGVATLITWPARAGQIDAYNHAVHLLRDSSEWLGFFDVDEYLVLHQHDSIDGYLASCNADQILLPWRNFPYGGHTAAPGGADTENYFWAHRNRADLAVQVKHLVRPRLALNTTAHFSFLAPGGRIVMADGTACGPGHLITGPSYRGAQLNHYATRSLAENTHRLRKGQVDGGAEKQLAHFAPLTAEFAATMEYDPSILRHYRAFAQERERWSRIADRPHRYGMMQRRGILPSWNNIPFYFAKSFANYLLGKSEIMHATELPLTWVEPDGTEKNLQHFWASGELASVHFRIDQRAFLPFFMGSIHYGDFVRRCGYEARSIARDVDIAEAWSYTLDYAGTCLADIFDLQTATGVEITATAEGAEPTRVVLPTGSYAGLVYRPRYFLDNTAVTFAIRGKCRVRELILGALP